LDESIDKFHDLHCKIMTIDEWLSGDIYTANKMRKTNPIDAPEFKIDLKPWLSKWAGKGVIHIG
jgi:hypothetical protein